MSRYIGPVCRLCRREGVKLFLKGERCHTDKCAIERRSYAPGQHGQEQKKKLSNYGTQLREKQKVKRIYGLVEKQFRGYYHRAARMKGITGENLLSLLERRLDNVVYRMGFATNHTEARQIVRHGHILLNNAKVNIPSYIVKPSDKISVKEKSKQNTRIVESMSALDKRGVPSWMVVDKESYTGTISGLPSREEITMPIKERLIVELYSK